MKKTCLGIFAALVCLTASAQQKPHYTQYIQNQYIINPALSGIESYVDFKISHRQQWVGIEDAPVTTYISVQGPIGKKDTRVSATGVHFNEQDNPRGKVYWDEYEAATPHHGVGLQLITDRTGGLSRSSLFATYAYHLGLSARTSIAAGFGAGISQMNLDPSKLRFGTSVDPAIPNTAQSRIQPDANAGIYLYSGDYFIGVSAQQLIPQQIQFTENSVSKNDGDYIPHMFGTAGYRFMLGDDLNFTPSVLVKYLNPVPIQFDINAKLQYQDRAWIGGSYRLEDGFAGMIGLNVSNRVNIGYSYDYTTSQLRNYTRGTHEILLGFIFKNRNGDTCPRNVW